MRFRGKEYQLKDNEHLVIQLEGQELYLSTVSYYRWDYDAFPGREILSEHHLLGTKDDANYYDHDEERLKEDLKTIESKFKGLKFKISILKEEKDG